VAWLARVLLAVEVDVAGLLEHGEDPVRAPDGQSDGVG
jgi:hypothetical protein